MASTEHLHNNPPTPGTGSRHTRSKSSVLRSFIGHRRNGSSNSGLHATNPNPSIPFLPGYDNPAVNPDFALDMGASGYVREPRALGELQQNQQGQAPLSPTKKSRANGQRSPVKSGFSTLSFKSLATRDTGRSPKPKDQQESQQQQQQQQPDSPTKPKKAKSSTNIAGLLLRPRTAKNANKPSGEGEVRLSKDKENRTPPSSLGSDHAPPPPPIYAQFAGSGKGLQTAPASPTVDSKDPFVNQSSVSGSVATGESNLGEGIVMKQRPKSFQPPYVTRDNMNMVDVDDHSRRAGSGDNSSSKAQKRQTWAKSGVGRGMGFFGVFSGQDPHTKSTADDAVEPYIDPKDIDKHLEAMLNRRNIPENQRYKMRNLADTIKMEFIRQDWAETRAAKTEHPSIGGDGDVSAEPSNTTAAAAAAGADPGSSKKKKHRSLTLSKGVVSKGLPSPKKLRPESTLGRHFRSKSTDDVTSDRPTSSASSSSSGLFSKIKGQQGPVDFVAYLRTVRQPESVEVGRLHKLRILLRNETVAWTEEFIRQGGMKEIVGLLHRIMEVEWREEHEDALLHENLLCLKALCTTALALQYLRSIHATLLPALLHMIFDPEKKGPSEFTTRNIITSVLLTYIECATPPERVSRVQTVLGYLRDPEAKEQDRPVSFVLEMRRDRPYRVWCKELVNVTKEVFWIFLHNLNVIALPPASERPCPPSSKLATSTISTTTTTTTTTSLDQTTKHATGQDPDQGGTPTRVSSHFDYMARHFPKQRPPVPAAPYVGGVEWEATNYLASHLDLMNAIVACTGPTSQERNLLRAQLRISGWERCLGGSLRLCKEKFYGAIHDGLRTWVAAAAEDGWDVRDVRYGPAPESRSTSPNKKVGGGRGVGKNKDKEAPPRLDMPKLELGLDKKATNDGRPNNGWLP